ncbi:MFS transporter [Fluviispira vulneris]|uniref:MFS transporter n=1 Tax=Fluviispira vulneris TaxID=2763012 RepID=UPI001646E7BF|nr:MFS transporter [Fluviispira vulneris]
MLKNILFKNTPILGIDFFFTLFLRIYILYFSWYLIAYTNNKAHLATSLGIAFSLQIIGYSITPYIKMNIKFFLKFVITVVLTLIILTAFLKNFLLLNIISFCVINFIYALFAAKSNMLVALIHKDNLNPMLELKSALSSINIILGPVLSGILIDRWGGGAALCSMILLSALTLFYVFFLPNHINMEKSESKKAPLKRLFQIKTEFYLGFLAIIFNLVLQPMITLMLPIFVLTSLKLSTFYVGLLEASIGAGILLTSFVILKKLKKSIGAHNSILLGIFLLIISIFILSLNQQIFIICSALFLFGVGIALFNINTTQLRIAATPSQYRGDIESAIMTVCTAGIPFGHFIFGKLNTIYDIKITIIFSGFIILISSIIIFFVPYFSKICKLNEKDLEGIYAKFYPKAFE